MFEDLLSLSSSEEKDDIEIVEEGLGVGKQISSPRKIEQIVNDIRKQGHVPTTTAVKVRNIKFFTAKGPLSLAEVVDGEGNMKWRYKINTVMALSNKRRKIEMGVQPQLQPDVPSSLLPLRKKITDQLKDQVGGGRQNSDGVDMDLLASNTSKKEEEVVESERSSTMTEVSEVTQAKKPQEVPLPPPAPPASQEGGQLSGLWQQEFLSYSHLIAHQQLEERR